MHPSPSSLADSASERTLYHYLALLKRYRRLIAGITAVFLVIALLIAFLTPRAYSAAAMLRISTYAPILPGKSSAEDVLRQQTAEEEYFTTQIEQLTSLPLADLVLSDPKVQEVVRSEEAKPPALLSYLHPSYLLSVISPASSDAPHSQETHASDHYSHSLLDLRTYLSRISVQPVKRTALVQVAAVSPQPETSALLANAHSTHFVELVQQERQKATEETLTFLQARSKELQDKIADLEGQLAKYAEENAIVSLENDKNITLQQVEAVSRQLTASRGKRIESQNNYDQGKRKEMLSSTFLDDHSIEELRQELARAQSEQARLLNKFTPEYPAVVQVAARIKELKAGVINQRQQALRSLEGRYLADRSVELELLDELELMKGNAFELSKLQVGYNSMKREFESFKDLHQAVLRQIKEAQIRLGSLTSNISIVEHAAVPFIPSKPRRKILVIMGLVTGLLAGFFTALALDLVEKRIKSADQIEGMLGTSLLGVVPLFSTAQGSKEVAGRTKVHRLWHTVRSYLPWTEAAESKKQHALNAKNGTPLLTSSAQHSFEGEAFRNIRASIRLSSADSPLRTILITSAEEKSGKTTLTANLGIAFAQDSSRTIIVDADLRRPKLSHYVRVASHGKGLVEVLTGQCTLDEAIIKTSEPNLWILPSGAFTPNPAELIGSERMARLITTLGERFGHVLIDSAPILPVADSLLLSRLVDGVAFVVRSNYTYKNAAWRSLDKLELANAPVIGSILNGVDLKRVEFAHLFGRAYSVYGQDAHDRAA